MGSTLPAELAIILHSGCTVTISPYLIFVPQSAQNYAGTSETFSLMFAVPARTHIKSPNVTGEENGHELTGTNPVPLSYHAITLPTQQ